MRHLACQAVARRSNRNGRRESALQNTEPTPTTFPETLTTNARESSTVPLHSKKTLTTTLLAGVATLALTALCWTWFDFATRAGNELVLAYVGVGAFCLGALPAALATAKRLFAPALVVSALYLLSAYGTWSVYVAPATPPAPVDPTPFGWFLLWWPVVTVAALLVGGVEFGVRRYCRRLPMSTSG